MRFINSALPAGAMLLTHVAAQSNTVPVTGLLGNATVVNGNPVGVTYVAELPSTEFFNPQDPRGNVKGSISATAGPNGVGVTFQVSFSNLPTSGGPFLYHLHEAPVPSDGNCTGTLAHIDPYERGEAPPCDSSLPQTCQVGDLAGKYGAISSDPFKETYTDEFTSTLVGSKSFFPNGSLTLHFANKTRLTCANFTLVKTTSPAGGNNSSNSTSTSSPVPSTPTPSAVIGASSQTVVPVVSLLVFLVAGLML